MKTAAQAAGESIEQKVARLESELAAAQKQCEQEAIHASMLFDENNYLKTKLAIADKSLEKLAQMNIEQDRKLAKYERELAAAQAKLASLTACLERATAECKLSVVQISKIESDFIQAGCDTQELRDLCVQGAQAVALKVENESLRAECGLRQIQGYNDGKLKAEAERDAARRRAACWQKLSQITHNDLSLAMKQVLAQVNATLKEQGK